MGWWLAQSGWKGSVELTERCDRHPGSSPEQRTTPGVPWDTGKRLPLGRSLRKTLTVIPRERSLLGEGSIAVGGERQTGKGLKS
ncbi:MAG: hypothetical protein HC925_00205 [Coleofasciculaceae cyanobacterium SM2_3_26]|nr:hypothetical protein [Coleofasciculaceae cyanobacterium SM2_3_26]